MGAALIGAKASSDAAKASQNKGIDLKKLRKEAEAAGFNPLTVLRATGGQGFNKGSSGALASASFWSSFANSAGQIAGQFDPLRKAQREANLAETRAQTAYLGSLTSANGKRIAGVQMTSAYGKRTAGIPVISDVNDVQMNSLGYSDQQINYLVNEAIARSDKGDFVDNKVRGLQEPIVKSSGKVNYYPKGMEFDELFTGVLMQGRDQINTEVQSFYRDLVKPILSRSNDFGPLMEKAKQKKAERKQRFNEYWN
jgi:hypothetical protein